MGGGVCVGVLSGVRLGGGVLRPHPRRAFLEAVPRGELPREYLAVQGCAS